MKREQRILAASLVVLAAAACRMPTAEEQRAAQEQRKKAVRQATDKLAAMYDAFPKSDLEDGHCPESRIADIMRRHPDRRKMPTVELSFLERYTNPTVKRDWENDPWSFLTDPLIRHLRSGSEPPAGGGGARDQAYRATEILKHPLLVVLRTEERKPPRVSIADDDPNLWVLWGGAWSGWAGVYEVEREEYLCFTRVASGYVNVSDKATAKDDVEAFMKAAFRDLAKQVGSQTNESLTRISPKLGFVLL
jgi:hypothetical protein